METSSLLEKCGCIVLGPVPRLAAALKMAADAAMDGAVLDINLAGEFCFPVALLLRERGIPFMFVSGYDEAGLIPPALLDAPRLRKPFDPREVERAAVRHFTA